MRILIVEFTSHQKKLPHLFKVFGYNYLPDILIHKKDKKYLSNIPDGRIITSSDNSIFDYFILLFKATNYNRIFISTGPEYISGISGIIHILGFYIYCKILGSKTILNVLNSNSYIKNQQSFSNKTIHRIRVNAAANVHKFTFEGKLTLNYFKDYTSDQNNRLAISSIYYSDVRLNSSTHFEKDEKNTIKIGITGRIDPVRKDYNKLFNVLKNLSEQERNNLKLIVLGECNNPEARKLIYELEKLIEVNWHDGYISDNDFEKMGLECDVLFSPLPENFGYGLTKETGAFGDAIYLHRKVIIPQFSCLNGEFDPISVYYNNEDELLSIFKKLLSENNQEFLSIDPAYLDKYSTASIFSQISKDLNL
jgi:glycosyltransferase involved in cell wall biosynthesis